MPHTPDPKELVQQDLIKQVALGRKQSLQKLYDLSHKDIYRYLHRVLCDKKCVDEALVKTYCDVWHKAAELTDSTENVLNWMLAIARNNAQDKIDRKEQKNSDNKNLDKQSALNTAIRQLDPKVREVLGLVLMSDTNYAMLATRLGTSDRDARDRVHQAISEVKKLKKSGESH
jgi:DNA-directed RNA polymerase specialized sigma24 family protein